MKKLKSKLAPKEIELLIANNIQQQREVLGLTQTEVAEALGVVYTVYQKIELGERRLYSGVLWQIAEVLDIPMQNLFAGINKDEDVKKVALSPFVYATVKILVKVPKPVQKNVLDLVRRLKLHQLSICLPQIKKGKARNITSMIALSSFISSSQGYREVHTC